MTPEELSENGHEPFYALMQRGNHTVVLTNPLVKTEAVETNAQDLGIGIPLTQNHSHNDDDTDDEDDREKDSTDDKRSCRPCLEVTFPVGTGLHPESRRSNAGNHVTDRWLLLRHLT